MQPLPRSDSTSSTGCTLSSWQPQSGLSFEVVSVPEQQQSHHVIPASTLRKWKQRNAKRPGYIPRPPNSFVFFRCDFVRQHTGTGGDLSRRAGIAWKRLPKDMKEQYRQRAAAAAAEHKQLFPHYVYQPEPRKATVIRSCRQSDRSSSPISNGAQSPIASSESSVSHQSHLGTLRSKDMPVSSRRLHPYRRSSPAGTDQRSLSSSSNLPDLDLEKDGICDVSVPQSSQKSTQTSDAAWELSSLRNNTSSASFWQDDDMVGTLASSEFFPHYGNDISWLSLFDSFASTSASASETTTGAPAPSPLTDYGSQFDSASTSSSACTPPPLASMEDFLRPANFDDMQGGADKGQSFWPSALGIADRQLVQSDSGLLNEGVSEWPSAVTEERRPDAELATGDAAQGLQMYDMGFQGLANLDCLFGMSSQYNDSQSLDDYAWYFESSPG